MIILICLFSFVFLVISQTNQTNSTSNVSLYAVPLETNTSRLYQTLYVAVPILDDYIPPFPYNEQTIAYQEESANQILPSRDQFELLNSQFDLIPNSDLYNWTQNQIKLQQSSNYFRNNLMDVSLDHTLNNPDYNQDQMDWMDRYTNALNGIYYTDRDIQFTVQGILINKIYLMNANKTNVNQDQGNVNLYKFGKQAWEIINQDKQCYQQIWDRLRVIAQQEILTYQASLPQPQVLTPVLKWNNDSQGITQKITTVSNCSYVNSSNQLCLTNTTIVYNIFTSACLINNVLDNCQNYTINQSVTQNGTTFTCPSSKQNCISNYFVNTQTKILQNGFSNLSIANYFYNLEQSNVDSTQYTLTNTTNQFLAQQDINGNWSKNNTFFYYTKTFYKSSQISNNKTINFNINSTISQDVNIINSTNYTVTTTNNSNCQQADPYSQTDCSYILQIQNTTDVCTSGISNCTTNKYDNTEQVTHQYTNTCDSTFSQTCSITTTDTVTQTNCLNAPTNQTTGCQQNSFTRTNLTSISVIPNSQDNLDSIIVNTQQIKKQYTITTVNNNNNSDTNTSLTQIDITTQMQNCTNSTDQFIISCANQFKKTQNFQNCPNGNQNSCVQTKQIVDLEIFNVSNTTISIINKQTNYSQNLTTILKSKYLQNSVDNVVQTSQVYYDILQNLSSIETTYKGDNSTTIQKVNGSSCVIDFDGKSSCSFNEFNNKSDITNYGLIIFFNGTDQTTKNNTVDDTVLEADTNPSYQKTKVIINTSLLTLSDLNKSCYTSSDNTSNCTTNGSVNTQYNSTFDTFVNIINLVIRNQTLNSNITVHYVNSSTFHNNIQNKTNFTSYNSKDTRANKNYSKTNQSYTENLSQVLNNDTVVQINNSQNQINNLISKVDSTSNFQINGTANKTQTLQTEIDCMGNCTQNTYRTSNLFNYTTVDSKINLTNSSSLQLTNIPQISITQQISDFNNQNSTNFQSNQSNNSQNNNCIITNQSINQSQSCLQSDCISNLQYIITNTTCNNYTINTSFVSSQNDTVILNKTCIGRLPSCTTTKTIQTNYSSLTINVLNAICQFTLDNRKNCTNQTQEVYVYENTYDQGTDKQQSKITYMLQKDVFCLSQNGQYQNCTFNVFNTTTQNYCTKNQCNQLPIQRTQQQKYCIGGNSSNNCQVIPAVYIDYNICPNNYYQSSFDPRINLSLIDAQIQKQLQSNMPGDEYLKVLIQAQLAQNLKIDNDFLNPLEQTQIQSLGLENSLEMNETSIEQQMDYLFGDGNASILLSENNYFENINNLNLTNHKYLGRVFDLNQPNVTFKWELKDIYLINISQFFPMGINTEIVRSIENKITEPPEGWGCRRALIYESLMQNQNQSFNLSQLHNQNLNISLQQNKSQIDYVIYRMNRIEYSQPGLPILMDQLVDDQIQYYKTNLNRLLLQNPLDNYTNLKQDQIYISTSKAIKTKFKVFQLNPMYNTIYYTLQMQSQKSQTLSFSSQVLKSAFNDSNIMYVGTFQCLISGLNNTIISAVQPFMFTTRPNLTLNSSIQINIINSTNQKVDLTQLIRDDTILNVTIQDGDAIINNSNTFNGTVFVGQYSEGLFKNNKILTSQDNVTYPLIFPTIIGQDVYAVLALKPNGNFNYQLIKVNTSNPFFSCADYYLPSTNINLTDIDLTTLDNTKLQAIIKQLMIDATSNSQLIQNQLKQNPIVSQNSTPIIYQCGYNNSCNYNGQCINFNSDPIMNCLCNKTFLPPFCKSATNKNQTIELANIMINQINSINIGQSVTVISAIMQNEVNNTILTSALTLINNSQSNFNNQTQMLNGIQALSDIKNAMEVQGTFPAAIKKIYFSNIRQIQQNLLFNLTKYNFTNNVTQINYSTVDTVIQVQSLNHNQSASTDGTTTRRLLQSQTTNTTLDQTLNSTTNSSILNTTNSTDSNANSTINSTTNSSILNTTNSTDSNANSTINSTNVTCQPKNILIQSDSIYYGGLVIQGSSVTFNSCSQASQKQYLVSIKTQTLDYYKYEFNTSNYATQIVQVDFYDQNYTNQVQLDRNDQFNLTIGVSKFPGQHQFVRGIQIIQNNNDYTEVQLDRSLCQTITLDPPIAVFTLAQSGLYGAVIEDEGVSTVPPRYVNINDTLASATNEENSLNDQTTLGYILFLGVLNVILITG